MKRAYVTPTMVGERFVANEYVAACGGTEYGKYKFVCDAGGGAAGNVYVESNGTAGLQAFGINRDRCLTEGLGKYFYACNKTHEADTKDDFLNGYYVPLVGRKQDVIIWTEGGRDVHCTTNLNRESWETTKS